MQFKTPINQFIPEMQEVLKEFARKSHAVNLIVEGKLPTSKPTPLDGEPPEETGFRKAIFIDPRFPNKIDAIDRVGAVDWRSTNDGSQFVVESRLIKNDKYRKGSADYRTKATKNVAKLIKTMVENIKPFSYHEIFSFNKSLTIDLVTGWRGENYDTGERGWVVYSNDTYAEIKHLRDLGVQFKTDTFRKLAENLEAREEHTRRNKQQVEAYHIYIDEQSERVAVSKKTLGPHDNVLGVHATLMYDSLEKLPEELLSSVSLLKILGEGEKMLRGVGSRVSANQFIVMKPLASDTNA
jgi:hypothetical protein